LHKKERTKINYTPLNLLIISCYKELSYILIVLFEEWKKIQKKNLKRWRFVEQEKVSLLFCCSLLFPSFECLLRLITAVFWSRKVFQYFFFLRYPLRNSKFFTGIFHVSFSCDDASPQWYENVKQEKLQITGSRTIVATYTTQHGHVRNKIIKKKCLFDFFSHSIFCFHRAIFLKVKFLLKKNLC
jgi:hypothetical protein